jgi:hypothetical protein
LHRGIDYLDTIESLDLISDLRHFYGFASLMMGMIDLFSGESQLQEISFFYLRSSSPFLKIAAKFLAPFEHHRGQCNLLQ